MSLNCTLENDTFHNIYVYIRKKEKVREINRRKKRKKKERKKEEEREEGRKDSLLSCEQCG